MGLPEGPCDDLPVPCGHRPGWSEVRWHGPTSSAASGKPGRRPLPRAGTLPPTGARLRAARTQEPHDRSASPGRRDPRAGQRPRAGRTRSRRAGGEHRQPAADPATNVETDGAQPVADPVPEPPADAALAAVLDADAPAAIATPDAPTAGETAAARRCTGRGRDGGDAPGADRDARLGAGAPLGAARPRLPRGGDPRDRHRCRRVGRRLRRDWCLGDADAGPDPVAGAVDPTGRQRDR